MKSYPEGTGTRSTNLSYQITVRHSSVASPTASAKSHRCPLSLPDGNRHGRVSHCTTRQEGRGRMNGSSYSQFTHQTGTGQCCACLGMRCERLSVTSNGDWIAQWQCGSVPQYDRDCVCGSGRFPKVRLRLLWWLLTNFESTN